MKLSHRPFFEVKRGYGLFLLEMVFFLELKCGVFWGPGVKGFGSPTNSEASWTSNLNSSELLFLI